MVLPGIFGNLFVTYGEETKSLKGLNLTKGGLNDLIYGMLDECD